MYSASYALRTIYFYNILLVKKHVQFYSSVSRFAESLYAKRAATSYAIKVYRYNTISIP